jgi:hypothetical protein
MRFTHVARNLRRNISGRNEAFLVDDGWDDYTFKTLFELVFFTAEGERIEVGGVKIFSRALHIGRVSIPETFSELDSEYCSLGQEANYYETLGGLSGTLGDQILCGLRDCVRDPSIYAAFRDEKGFQTSLLRSVSESNFLATFSGALRGQAKLTPFKFAYTFSQRADSPNRPRLTFDVDPDSMPPTNVHVVIGRNGVGKTHLLGNIAAVLCQSRLAQSLNEAGDLEFLSDGSETVQGERFANLVTVTFSAFDPFRAPQVGAQTDGDIRYAYVGLKKAPQSSSDDLPEPADPHKAEVKGPADLSEEFQESLGKCLSGPRRHRWLYTIQTLETDPGI